MYISKMFSSNKTVSFFEYVFENMCIILYGILVVVHTAPSLFSIRWSSTVAAQISGCLADISAWMKEHHLQLNLAKTELLVFPATPTLQHDFTIQLGSSTITPSASVRNLGVIFNDQLTFKEHIAKTARSYRQVCITQHQKDQALSDRACCTTSCPGPCHF